MAYTKQGFENGNVLTAEALIAMEDGILGCAPSGFGLGGDSTEITADKLDEATGNGWYRVNGLLSIGNYASTSWIVRTTSYSGLTLVQELYETIGKHKVLRWRHNGEHEDEWAVEWVNPPLVVGEEYRTTERYNGMPVYTMAIDCGECPKSTGKSYDHGIANCRPLSVTGRTTTTNYALPFISAASGNGIHIAATSTSINIYSEVSTTHGNVIAVLKYYKEEE